MHRNAGRGSPRLNKKQQPEPKPSPRIPARHNSRLSREKTLSILKVEKIIEQNQKLMNQMSQWDKQQHEQITAHHAAQDNLRQSHLE